ncbi:MAG TPA: hypothetical protein ENF20_02055 [Candidatus Marinimicrobia bacterium]|nr:hypothetical protein [Candidatus Neomarinimicrobiota bacterium]
MIIGTRIAVNDTKTTHQVIGSFHPSALSAFMAISTEMHPIIKPRERKKATTRIAAKCLMRVKILPAALAI